MEPCRECGGDGGVALDVAAAAIAIDDMDAAIDAGLLAWTGCPACALRQGLALAQIEALHAARDFRLRALAARDRFRVREQRLRRRSAERDARQLGPGRGSATLPPAAAAALARAKAKAAQRNGS